MALDTVKQAKKRANCFATLLQNDLNSDVACFTTHEANLPCKKSAFIFSVERAVKVMFRHYISVKS